MLKKSYKNILFMRWRTLVIEVAASIFVTVIFLIALDFLNIIPRLPFISIRPFISYIKIKTQVKYYGYDLENHRPVAMQLDSNRDLSSLTTIYSLYFKTRINDIKLGKGSDKTAEGIIDYDMKMVTNTSPNPYYYKKDDFEKIKVYKRTKDKESLITLKELKKGDIIEVYFTSDFTTKKMVKLKIVKIYNSSNKIAELY